jgi:hypothetical protein
LASTPPTEEAFLREVDDELRRDQLQKMVRHYGRIALVALLLLLVAFAGFLYWRQASEKKAEAQGEQMSALIADVQASRKAEAAKKIDTLVAEGGDGYRIAALLTKATLAADRGDTKSAIGIYAGIAADEKAAQPYRDVSLIRQTLLEYDGLTPQQVIDRLKPLAVEGNAFFGTAGEMTAVAMIQANRGAEAGRLLAAVARDKTVPDTLRTRAARLATSLGVNVDVAPAAAPADKD